MSLKVTFATEHTQIVARALKELVIPSVIFVVKLLQVNNWIAGSYAAHVNCFVFCNQFTNCCQHESNLYSA